MSDVFFEEMQIPKPDYFLDVKNLSHGAITGRMLEKIESVLEQETPHFVMVYGDTNTTLAGALAAAKMRIPVVHVEAGLRSYNRRMPEEINRVLTDHMAAVLFCPTQQAFANLKIEGIGVRRQNVSAASDGLIPKVELVGDVMFDAALFYRRSARKANLDIPQKFILVTVHRAENTDDPKRLRGVMSGLERVGKQRPIVIPLHPRTQKIIKQTGLRLDSARVQVTNPVVYLNMIWLLKHCSLVMTDSGGLQKEAYFFKKPCITLRNETEWVELVEHGYNRLVGADADRIEQAAGEALDARISFDEELYGDGRAGDKIVRFLVANSKNHLGVIRYKLID